MGRERNKPLAGMGGYTRGGCTYNKARQLTCRSVCLAAQCVFGAGPISQLAPPWGVKGGGANAQRPAVGGLSWGK